MLDDRVGNPVSKAELERQTEKAIENGEYPLTHKLAGVKMANEPILERTDFWLIFDLETDGSVATFLRQDETRSSKPSPRPRTGRDTLDRRHRHRPEVRAIPTR